MVASSRLGSVEGVPPPWASHAWTVEHCILAASTGAALACPTHGDTPVRDVAPDLVSLQVLFCMYVYTFMFTLLCVLGMILGIEIAVTPNMGIGMSFVQSGKIIHLGRRTILLFVTGFKRE